jgi:transglutaminase-like putative cysteine protease
MRAGAATLAPPPPAPALLSRRAARVVGFGLLAAWAAGRWARLVAPAAPIELGVMLAGAVAWAALLLSAGRGRAHRAFSALGGMALLVGILLIAGIPAALALDPRAWGDLAGGIGQGIEALPGATTPYRGADPWARAVILVGGGLLLAGGAAAWAELRPDDGLAARARAAVPLVALAAVPGVLLADHTGVTQGLGLFAVLALALWLEDVRRDKVRTAAVLAAGAGLLGLAGGAALDPGRPWIDPRHLADSLQPARPATFGWTHSYGPLDWPRTGREVLRVRMDRPVRLKSENLDGFDGVRWRPTPLHDLAGARSELPPGPLARRWTQTLRITVRHLETNDVIGAGTILDLRQVPAEVVPAGSPGTFTAQRPLHSGDAYRATVYAAAPSAARLARASTRYPRWVDPYRSVGLGGALTVEFPPFGSGGAPQLLEPNGGKHASVSAVARSPYARAYRLARRLTAGAATPAAATARIRAFFARGFTYAEDVPATRRPLVSFLFESRRGYCQHFSGAMALLLRMAGVPARVSTGFTSGSRDEARDEWVVHDFDAHSWIEAWFPGTGWVTFDPTPAAAPALGARDATPGQLGGDRPALFDRSPVAPASRPEGRAGSRRPELIALAAVLAAAALGAAGLALRRRPRAGDAVAELAAVLRRTGRPPGLTLRGLERALAGTPDAETYVRRLRDARYGWGTPPTGRSGRRAVRRALQSSRWTTSMSSTGAAPRSSSAETSTRR